MIFPSLLTLLVAVYTVNVSAIPTIEVKGSKFFTSDGEQFFMKGVAYQLTPLDPLLDAAVCEKNFALMAQMGTNIIRTYHVDPWEDHTACMSILEKYGIYLLLDIDTFNTTIVQDNPYWDYYQLRSYEHVISAFAQYDNLFGFFAGNEIVNTNTGTAASPYIKASVRDAKNFISSQGYRTIPVGYSAADIAEIRPAFQNYLVCDDGATNDATSSIDFFGLNIYEWCGTSTYQESGYQARTAEVADYPVPVFFSEFGCNVVQPRQFEDIPVLYGPEMSAVWSGGIVYEWLEEANDYGIVNIDTAGNPTPRADFTVISSRWAQASPTSVALSAYSPTNSAPSCPTNTGGFSVGSTALPPTPTNDGTSDWEPVSGAQLAVASSSTPALASVASSHSSTMQPSSSTHQASASSISTNQPANGMSSNSSTREKASTTVASSTSAGTKAAAAAATTSTSSSSSPSSSTATATTSSTTSGASSLSVGAFSVSLIYFLFSIV